ncbi:DNA-processing protein DprA [Humibacter sp.]|uniref:DNA-processing protein DprA n=1 Tax=Humibacter sp. TaxID=1940291 RepID=UPI003F807A2F
MTVFGLDESHVRELVTGVSAVQKSDLDDREVADRFARAAWSVITEPGDGTAGALVAERGAAEALRFALRDAQSGRATEQSTRAAEGVAGPLPLAATPLASSHTPRGPDHPAADAEETSQLKAGLDRWRPRMRSGDVERALLLAARVGARMLVPGTDRGPWPGGADDLGPHAPIALWARGDATLLPEERAGVALVGARAATGYGEHIAGEASAGLVGLGYAIVSGAAYGVDGMAHRAALAAGGLTLAFLAGGVDRFYPAGHDDLLRRITEHGLVLSELPCGAAPTKWRFLQRNRLIAACSDATVVVEAGARSGSLNTAGHASSLGRPLGAFPGPVTSPASAGCHRLLREYDAVCVTNAREIAELVGRPSGAAVAAAGADPDGAGRDDQLTERSAAGDNGPRDSPETVRVLDALATRVSRTPGDIAARSGLAVGAVIGVLGTLEVEGRVRDDAAGWRAVPRRA